MFDKEIELSYEFDIIKPCIYWTKDFKPCWIKSRELKVLNHIGLKSED